MTFGVTNQRIISRVFPGIRTGDALSNRTMILFGEGGSGISVRALEEGCRFLFFSGIPLREPIAWGGPIVMNTDAEVRQALAEYRNGTFIRG